MQTLVNTFTYLLVFLLYLNLLNHPLSSRMRLKYLILSHSLLAHLLKDSRIKFYMYEQYFRIKLAQFLHLSGPDSRNYFVQLMKLIDI